jgi:hypothetical protein
MENKFFKLPNNITTRVKKIHLSKILVKMGQNYQEEHKMQNGINLGGQNRAFEIWGAKIKHFANLRGQNYILA